MAHFVRIDDSDPPVVVEGCVLDNADCLDEDGNESEAVGAAYISRTRGGTWMQTSYNTLRGKHEQGGSQFRKNYAGLGFTYDATLDAFIPPKGDAPDDWVLDPEEGDWIPPIPKPADWKTQPYDWDNDTSAWVKYETDPPE